ncbi:MAG: PAS domain S-box protein [Fischerella sp. CENA71]|nr:PAS domain S-box protein [Fischerella sp. CENA71]
MNINYFGSQNLKLSSILHSKELLKIRRVREVMNTQVVHATPDTSVMDVACLMSEHQASCVVIAKQSQDEQIIPLGIITEYDLVQFQALKLDFTQTQVRSIMSSPLFSLHPEDSLSSANERMQSLRVRQLVVVGNQGELLGILSQSNILQVLDPMDLYDLVELLQHRLSQQQTEMVEVLADRKQLEEQLQQGIIELKARAKREQLITSIALRIRESLDLDTALITVAEDVRYVLKADRALVYQFTPDMNGKILAESVSNGWTTALGSEIKNISWSGVEDIFIYGNKQAIANIYELQLTDSQLQILEQLQVKAYLIVPIVISNQLWGLLITHQCSNFRQWKEDEVNLLEKIAIQLAVAIKQVELYNQARIQLAERHKIEAQLRLERNFISTVLNVADALILVLDYQGRIVKFNHACEQTTGYTYDFVQGKFLWDFLLISEEIETVKAAFKNLKQRGIRNHQENYWLTKDGEVRLISWSNNVLLNRDEQVEYIVCTGIDITESRKAEEELRHTRNFLQSMIDNLPVAVFVKDARPENFGKFQLLNKACEHILGLKGEHAIGKTDYEFFPKEQAEFFLKKDVETIFHGLPQDIPEESIDSYKLGRRILHTTKVPLYDKYGQPEHLLCISEDITERKQAEEKLRQAKEQLQTVLDAVPGFVSWVSSDGRYLGVNKRLAQSFNLSPDAFIGQELGFMQKSQHFTQFMRDFLANQDVAASSVINSQIGDTTRSYLLVAQKYQKNTAAVTIGIDITEHKQTEIALAESEAMLRSVLDSTPSFVSMVNRERKILFVNQTIPDLSIEEVIGTNIDYYVFSEDCHIQHSALERVFECGEVVSYETRGVNTDGSFTYNYSQAGPIWRDGQVTAAVIVTDDISDRKQAEAALRESEQKFRLFTENIRSTFWIADLRGDSSQIVYVSPAFEEIWGRSTEEAYASSDIFLQAVYPADRQRFIADRPKRMQSEYSEEYRIIRPDGAIRWIHSRAFPVKNQNLEVYRVTGIAEDITERKQAEIALQNLIESTVSTTGQDFFPALVQYISSALDIRHACVSELINEQLHTLGFWSDGQLKPNVFYNPKSKPWNILLQQRVYHCCCRVEQLFPDIEALAVMQASSFMGVTLSNNLGEPIGTLWIVDEKPITDPDKFEGILKVFAARAAAELQRQRAQEALQKLNRELESRVEQRTLELQKSEAELKRQFAAVEAVNFITQRIRESLDLQAILNVAVAEIYKLLKVDRVLIYHILADGTGKVVAEALTPGYKSILEQSFPIEYFPTTSCLRYAQGEIYALGDRQECQHSSCLTQFMEDMQIQAKLVIPIVQQGVLWGLLIAHQCSHLREWKTGEIELLQQLANQLAIATKQSGLYAQLQVELSDRKQAETELRQVKERLEFLISSSPAVIFTAKPLTRNYYPTYISENVINLVGYSAEEFLSDPDFWLNRIHPEDAPQIVENLPQLIETGHHTQEYRWLHCDGEYRWMFDELKLVRDQHGNPLEIIGLWMEISDRKKAEEDIRKALEKEKELSDLKSRFVAMTSHEFRTPLAVIASSAGILKSFSHKLDNEQQHRHLQCIQTYVQHTTRLLDDILLINKAEAGKLAFEPTDIDLNDFCGSLVEELQLSSPNHTLIFSAQYLGSSAAGNNFTAHLDKKLLRQMLSNLLSNAVKYSPDGSNVQIDLLIQDKSAVFLITDEGIGISKQEQQNLFESFYRASNVSNIPGTGLGLTIVKKCVELQGGQISVISDIGAGTTFRVELPLFTA